MTANKARPSLRGYYTLTGLVVSVVVLADSIVPFVVGQSLASYGIAYSALAAATASGKAAFSVLAGLIADALGHSRAFKLFAGVQALAYLLLAFPSQSKAVIITGHLLGTASAGTVTCLNVFAGQAFPRDEQASIIGKSGTLWNAAFFLAPTLLHVGSNLNMSHETLLVFLSCVLVVGILSSTLLFPTGARSQSTPAARSQKTSRPRASVMSWIQGAFPTRIILVWFFMESITPVFDIVPVIATLSETTTAESNVVNEAQSLSRIYAASSLLSVLVSWTSLQKYIHDKFGGVQAVASYGFLAQAIPILLLRPLVQSAGLAGVYASVLAHGVVGCFQGPAHAAWRQEQYADAHFGLSHGSRVALQSAALASAQLVTGSVRSSYGIWLPSYAAGFGLALTTALTVLLSDKPRASSKKNN